MTQRQIQKEGRDSEIERDEERNGERYKDKEIR